MSKLPQPAKLFNVLLADDDADDQVLAAQALAVALPQVSLTIASNAIEAFNYLESQHFDLLISDLRMPLLSGFEVLQQLKGHPHFKKLPVVIFSTSANPDDIQKCRQLGAVHYITKPQVFEEWITVLRGVAEFLPSPKSAV